jgi:exopolysaccharide biosynthesis polyprenyl glycosylphosphotransferase
MKSNSSLIYNCFLVLGDFLSLVLAFAGAYIIRVTFDHRKVAFPIHALTYIELFAALLPIWILIFALMGLYNNNIYEKRFAEAGRLLLGSFLGTTFVITYAYTINTQIFPAHLVPFYGLLLAFLFLLIFRNLARYIRSLLFSYDIGITNVLIVGNTSLTHELINSLFNYRLSGYRIVGVVGPSKHNNELFEPIPIFKSIEQAEEVLGPNSFNSLVQTEFYAEAEKNNAVLSYAQTNHVSYRFIPGNTELFVGNIAVELFRNTIPVIAVHQTPLIGWGRIAKRLFDLVSSLLALIILSPILLILCILVFASDPGPILFKQERITRYNGHFKVFKFRTMKKGLSGRDPVEVFRELGRDDLVSAYQNAKKLSDDPRITFMGGFLRRFSLDELPQLLNVIRGDISLVGPRAVIEQELKYYDDKSPMLLSVKTGITGLAQVSGRSNIDYYERARLDLYYVQNWNFWLDVTILFKTIRVIFRRSGVR